MHFSTLITLIYTHLEDWFQYTVDLSLNKRNKGGGDSLQITKDLYSFRRPPLFFNKSIFGRHQCIFEIIK